MSVYLLESERTAMAILRSGRSFAEAANSTRVPVERVMALWKILEENKLQS